MMENKLWLCDDNGKVWLKNDGNMMVVLAKN